ncbi:sugar phosphate isomerase/epimerase family protein [Streptomyces gibsoniae]|uniref:Sugar phosphate isomerase/epimerase family protein n=1 Tax=Streptomyces gibsoniae TaxID=3075529 RepID=A0ABU2TLQ7_9ACTN|nr:sugar phosphate isomerase/epimerase family protein [Streptomyces sp. DSM 41699]MDT0461873.1 sugar phosphate isomerase/epimerase family protein [Streptomyces sp. DSM 41699]
MLADASSGIALAGIGDEAAYGIHAQVAAIRALDWRAIELRCVDGIPLADLPEPEFARVVTAVEDARLRVVAVDSRIGGWSRAADGDFAADLDELRVLASRCRTLGTRHVRIMSYPSGALGEPAWRAAVIRRIKVLTEHAERAGLVLLHENCAGWAGTRPGRMRELLEAVDSPALGLLFDIGNGIAYDYSAYAVLREVVEWVRHVHVKDAEGPATAPAYRLPGQGHARVADCLRLLLDSGYTGALSIEPHLAVVPHEGRRAPDTECAASFVAAGRALGDLLGTLTTDRRGLAPATAGRVR